MIIIENTYSELEPANAYLLHNSVQVPGMGNVTVFHDLVKGYDNQVEDLNGLSLSVHTGNFIALCGKPEGGETPFQELLRELGRLISDRVTIGCEDTFGKSEDESLCFRLLSRGGFVLKDQRFLSSSTVRVSSPLLLDFTTNDNGGHRDTLISDFRNQQAIEERKKGTCGGEARKAVIAGAIANDSRILIVIGPTGYFDKENAENLIERSRIERAGIRTTAVLDAHDSNFAGRALRKLHLVYGGIEHSTPPDEPEVFASSIRISTTWLET